MIQFYMVLMSSLQPEAYDNKAITTKCFSEEGMLYQGDTQNLTQHIINSVDNQSYYVFEDAKSKKLHVVFGSCFQSTQTAVSEKDEFLAPNN